MTEAEIIKALECCSKPYCNNNNCPLHRNTINTKDCITQLSTNALDLINRQNAEIERLTKEPEEAAVSIFDAANRFLEHKKLMQYQKEEIERLQSILLKFVREINNFENKHNIDTSDFSLIPILENEKNNIVKQMKSEAIKEFAERLKEKQQSVKARFGFGGEYISNGVMCTDIDNLVKEMVGDTE